MVGKPGPLTQTGLDSGRREKGGHYITMLYFFCEFWGDLGTVRKVSARRGRLYYFHNFWTSGSGAIRVPSRPTQANKRKQVRSWQRLKALVKQKMAVFIPYF